MNITNDMIACDVMGWHTNGRGSRYVDVNDRYVGFGPFNSFANDALFNPLADYNHCRLVEERMIELGLWNAYVVALRDILKSTLYDDDDVFGFMMATAAQRCEAAYRAWKEWSDAR